MQKKKLGADVWALLWWPMRSYALPEFSGKMPTGLLLKLLTFFSSFESIFFFSPVPTDH
jgi:hypothetical protein